MSGSVAAFNEITLYTASGDVAVAGSALDILKLNELTGATNHNRGAIHFGSDGLLHVAVGENANPANSQTLGNLLGKVLRIDVSRSTAGDAVNNVAKLVPSTNPFVNQATEINGVIYALSFRNPATYAVKRTATQFIANVSLMNAAPALALLAAKAGWDFVNASERGGKCENIFVAHHSRDHC